MTSMPSPRPDAPSEPARAALKSLHFLRKKMLAAMQTELDLPPVHSSHAYGARNLLAYLAMRRHDIRLLQDQLRELGLSSLGRCERDALGAVERVLTVLEAMLGERPEALHAVPPATLPARVTAAGDDVLVEHGRALFGTPHPQRAVRIMVTMPTHAATDAALVEQCLAAGMDCQRINCAHDGPAEWLKMIEHARTASDTLGRPCQVAMDLPGPKLRTGAIAAGPAVLKLRPQRGDSGAVLEPARVLLRSGRGDAADGIRLPGKFLKALSVGDWLKCRDARGAKRRLQVVEATSQGLWAQLHKTTYLMPGIVLKRLGEQRPRLAAEVLGVPPRAQGIKLFEGDLLHLTRAATPGAAAVFDAAGTLCAPAHVSCTAPAVFAAIQPGEPIWFDDGKIGGVVLAKDDQAVQIKITHAPGGIKLKADKGINLPDSTLGLEALGEADLQALAFAAQHADIVELSFVNSAQDVREVFDELRRLDAGHLGVVLKIETRSGFENLPALLLTGMQHPRLGVMIARGDLAVEAGFERTAELQEEMLCLCEAAQVPVIWATQVLETLAKTGAPTRAEMTDAAMGVRAECVMLNKGPYILKAITTLDNVLTRMQGHHDKKRDLMKKLHVAQPPAL